MHTNNKNIYVFMWVCVSGKIHILVTYVDELWLFKLQTGLTKKIAWCYVNLPLDKPQDTLGACT